MWLWFALAGVCLSLELMTGSFYLLFLAIGLAVGGIMSGLDFSFYPSLFSCLAVSLLCVLIFYRSGINKSTPDANMNLDIGSTVEVTQWQGRHTTVIYRGARWQAVLATPLEEGSKGPHQIIDMQGSTLILRPLS